MKDLVEGTRNAVFVLMIPTFIALFFSLGPQFDIPCNLLGIEGLILVGLTLWLRERRMQKRFLLGAIGSTVCFVRGRKTATKEAA